MKRLGLASFALGLLVVLSAQGGGDDVQKKEKAALSGVWKITSFEKPDGKDEGFVGVTLEFGKDGKGITLTKDGEAKKGSYKINPAAKPKEIDIKPSDEAKAFEGIYELKKNKLRLCLAHGEGDGRPSTFAVKEGKKYILITLERAK